MITPHSEKENKSIQIVRTFITTWNTHNSSAITQLLDPGTIFSKPLFSSPVRGVDERKQEIANFLTSMPDFAFKLIGIAADGNFVATEPIGMELQLAQRLSRGATRCHQAADVLSLAWPGSSA